MLFFCFSVFYLTYLLLFQKIDIILLTILTWFFGIWKWKDVNDIWYILNYLNSVSTIIISLSIIDSIYKKSFWLCVFFHSKIQRIKCIGKFYISQIRKKISWIIFIMPYKTCLFFFCKILSSKAFIFYLYEMITKSDDSKFHILISIFFYLYRVNFQLF